MRRGAGVNRGKKKLPTEVASLLKPKDFRSQLANRRSSTWRHTHTDTDTYTVHIHTYNAHHTNTHKTQIRENEREEEEGDRKQGERENSSAERHLALSLKAQQVT